MKGSKEYRINNNTIRRELKMESLEKIAQRLKNICRAHEQDADLFRYYKPDEAEAEV